MKIEVDPKGAYDEAAAAELIRRQSGGKLAWPDVKKRGKAQTIAKGSGNYSGEELLRCLGEDGVAVDPDQQTPVAVEGDGEGDDLAGTETAETGIPAPKSEAPRETGNFYKPEAFGLTEADPVPFSKDADGELQKDLSATE
jgi:hypothetical protein